MNVLEQAQAWLAEDPDPQTRTELQALIDASARAARVVLLPFSHTARKMRMCRSVMPKSPYNKNNMIFII